MTTSPRPSRDELDALDELFSYARPPRDGDGRARVVLGHLRSPSAPTPELREAHLSRLLGAVREQAAAPPTPVARWSARAARLALAVSAKVVIGATAAAAATGGLVATGAVPADTFRDVTAGLLAPLIGPKASDGVIAAEDTAELADGAEVIAAEPVTPSPTPDGGTSAPRDSSTPPPSDLGDGATTDSGKPDADAGGSTSTSGSSGSSTSGSSGPSSGSAGEARGRKSPPPSSPVASDAPACVEVPTTGPARITAAPSSDGSDGAGTSGNGSSSGSAGSGSSGSGTSGDGAADAPACTPDDGEDGEGSGGHSGQILDDDDEDGDDGEGAADDGGEDTDEAPADAPTVASDR